jgi:K+-transporting ATPase c subunit
MLTDLRRGAIALAAFTVLVGLAYPLLLLGVGQAAFSGPPTGAWCRARTARWSAPA